MQTDATGRVHSEGIPPRLIRPEVIAGLRRDAEAMLPPVFAEVVRACAEPLFQPIGDLDSPAMSRGRVALLGDAAFVARPHVGMGAIKAGQDAMALAAALAGADVEEGLARYDAARRRPDALIAAESRRLGAYIEGKASAPIPSPSCARTAASTPRTGTTAGSSFAFWRRPASPRGAVRSLSPPLLPPGEVAP